MYIPNKKLFVTQFSINYTLSVDQIRKTEDLLEDILKGMLVGSRESRLLRKII